MHKQKPAKSNKYETFIPFISERHKHEENGWGRERESRKERKIEKQKKQSKKMPINQNIFLRVLEMWLKKFYSYNKHTGMGYKNFAHRNRVPSRNRADWNGFQQVPHFILFLYGFICVFFVEMSQALRKYVSHCAESRRLNEICHSAGFDYSADDEMKDGFWFWWIDDG